MRLINTLWCKATFIAISLLVSTVLTPFTQPVVAQSCRNLSVYTDYLRTPDGQVKPAVYIWNGRNQPDPNRMTIKHREWYGRWGWQWETVPSPSDWGVNTKYPQYGSPKDGGWWIYYIATRWYTFHEWQDDSRWSVVYCG